MCKFSIGAHISLLYRAQQAFFTEKTKSYDIGGGQLSFIFMLFTQPGSSQDEVAKHLELDKTTVTRAVAKLEKNGMIERKRDEIDHRIIRLYLTDKGKELHLELKNVAHEWFATATKGMTEHDLLETSRLVTMMSENARQYRLMGCEEEVNKKNETK